MVTLQRKNASLLGVPTNREYTTYIESISAARGSIPAFIILNRKVHQSKWSAVAKLPPNYIIRVLETGYTNNHLSLDWLKHFKKHSKLQSLGEKRLLIIDSYSSHHIIEFLEYASEHNIVLFRLPPKLTHRLQPLNAVIFLPIKHWHSNAINNIV